MIEKKVYPCVLLREATISLAGGHMEFANLLRDKFTVRNGF